MRKNPIKIAGAGLAGLTAAINLAKSGYEVEVFEKESRVGAQYPENPQLLPNWFSKEDVIEELERCNVRVRWLRRVKEVEIQLPEKRILIYGKKIPVGYTVLRGGENSLEGDLAKQAENLGVKIVPNYEIARDQFSNFDIVAVGSSRALTVGYGQTYKGFFDPARVKVSFDPSYTPTIGYCYLFPHNQSIATIKISKKTTEEIDLKENLEKFKNQLKEIKKENFLREFYTKRSFKVPQSAICNGSFVVGEAAGFQDELFRFGIRYAILSGFLAAESIIEGLDYDILWKGRFEKEFKKIAKARRLFEKFRKREFKGLPSGVKYIEMEQLKKIWLSGKADFILSLSFFLQNLCFFMLFRRNFNDD